MWCLTCAVSHYEQPDVPCWICGGPMVHDPTKWLLDNFGFSYAPNGHDARTMYEIFNDHTEAAA